MRPISFSQWVLQNTISISLTIASVCPDRSAVFSFVFTFGHLNVRRSVCCLWLCHNDHSRGHQQGKSLDVTNKPHTRWLAVTVSFVWSRSSWRSAWESQALWPGEDHISRHVYFLNGHFIDFPTTRTLYGWPPTTRQTVPSHSQFSHWIFHSRMFQTRALCYIIWMPPLITNWSLMVFLIFLSNCFQVF